MSGFSLTILAPGRKCHQGQPCCSRHKAPGLFFGSKDPIPYKEELDKSLLLGFFEFTWWWLQYSLVRNHGLSISFIYSIFTPLF